MNKTVAALLKDKSSNHLLPFFWQHGEDEATLRHYMGVIEESGCWAVCVESRPHPDFCGPKWWRDMDVILDEARRRGMKVWILDDSHFPTGYANGAMLDAPVELCRQSVFCKVSHLREGAYTVTANINKLAKPPKIKPQSMIQRVAGGGKPKRRFDDDRLLGIIAVCQDDGNARFVDLADSICDGAFRWEKPKGNWKLCVVGLSRNLGAHRDYINMIDRDSCRVLIDTVYEPHYARYKEDFGTTIAGFFSDEPELGNGMIYPTGNILGTPQDLPWSRELEAELADAWGDEWVSKLPLLWLQDAGRKLIAEVRYTYMDKVTHLVERNFSMQLGNWCGERGVQYIGHVIEDNNQHARTGSSLGHYFRGLSGQHMAGIDNIGGQVYPQGEDGPNQGVMGLPRDGEFFHYVLGKLASSHAAIDPRKQGRAMCEIFGNYGWSCGVQLQKYLVDHFLVRGINEYVPHAFSPKEYPDSDCPPHFYAHGNNPQYRHFGELMRYTNRLCDLFSGGHHIAPVALLYHGEAEWVGDCMLMQKPARVLADNQIDFDIIPMDVFSEPERYKTKTDTGLTVNTQEYKALVIPMAEFLPADFAASVAELIQKGLPVIFLDALPKELIGGSGSLSQLLSGCEVVPVDGLVMRLQSLAVPELHIEPANNRIRYMHYRNNGDFYFFVNEGTNPYSGTVALPSIGSGFIYDAWHNCTKAVSAVIGKGSSVIPLEIEPGKSVTVGFAEYDANGAVLEPPTFSEERTLSNWTRSLCASKQYPHFSAERQIHLPEDLAAEKPKFSGFVRYSTQCEIADCRHVQLEITDAAEGVELFVNGQSMGIEIVPPYRYDITSAVRPGKNRIVIEVATTLERERAKRDSIQGLLMYKKPSSSSGITGEVILRLMAKR